MKSFFKKNTSAFVWESARKTYAYLRRLYFDIIQTASPLNPVEWAHTFFWVRTVRPTYTMVSTPRLKVLYELSKRINSENVAGDIVECGVYNGGSAAILAKPHVSRENRGIWLFDSFEGLPPPTENDGVYERENYNRGWCRGSVEKVEEIFKILHFPKKYLHIIRGWFSDTLPREGQKIGNIALLHIDADWYDSVKLCLETLYPKISRGGYVVIDDYEKWEGCRKAVNEYLSAHNVQPVFKARGGGGFYFKKS